MRPAGGSPLVDWPVGLVLAAPGAVGELRVVGVAPLHVDRETSGMVMALIGQRTDHTTECARRVARRRCRRPSRCPAIAEVPWLFLTARARLGATAIRNAAAPATAYELPYGRRGRIGGGIKES
jgi:hypothetical protein